MVARSYPRCRKLADDLLLVSSYAVRLNPREIFLGFYRMYTSNRGSNLERFTRLIL
jgi:hypothetical protein